MKIKGLLIGMLACTALVGCTNEDVVNNENEKGQQAYMAVTIVNPTSIDSRGVADNENPFEDGTASEGKVEKVDFYFYNQNGDYLRKGVTAQNPASGTNDEATNVENVYKALLVLETTENNQPHYVLAVVNNTGSDAFVGKSLSEAKTTLKNSSYLSDANFLMTNSSYVGAKEDFATSIDPASDLKTTAEAALSAPVKIYVERLAAKVHVTTPETAQSAKDVPTQTGEETTITQKELSINVLGWGLNATNKETYWIKNIDSNWKNTDDEFFVWNVPNNHRSYWAKSTNYGGGTYAVSYDSYTGNESLKYYTQNELITIKDDGTVTDKLVSDGSLKVQYCMENTNTSDILANRAYTTAATHVVVLARIGDGKTTYFKYNGVLYDQANYIATVLRDIKAHHGQIFAKLESETEYAPLNTAHITLPATTSEGDATKLNVEAVEGYSFYTQNEDASYTSIKFNDLLSKHVTTGDKTETIVYIPDAEGFNGGAMYYDIPIEHLEGTPWYTYDDNGKKVVVENPVEGQFGVVRNHYYKMTVNKIENLGTGLYRPNAPIIPSSDPDKYYLAAELRVLAWHVVSQSVDL